MIPREWLGRNGARLAALGCVGVFVAQGIAIIDLAGVQHDEALFAGAVLPPQEYTHSARILGHEIPLMLDSYLGCLKAWLYAAIFALWQPDVYSLRAPVLAGGAFVIWLVWRLMRRAVGTRAALATCALLATDTAFVLTSTLDWGPVVLQHLFMVMALWLLVRFHETPRRWRLAAAGLCCGLALWDKVAFAWTLAGLALAGALVFRREVAKALSWRNVAVFGGCLLVGAWPLLYANWGSVTRLVEVSGGFSGGHLEDKVTMLMGTLDGSGLIGYLTRFDPPEGAAAPEAALDRISVALSQTLGNPRNHWQIWALAAAILLVPVLRRSPARRPMLFSLMAAATAWLIIAATGRGGAGHHVVLLWPLPQMLAGTAAAGVSRLGRRAGQAVVAVLAVVCLSGLAVTNEYVAQVVRCGNSLPWTDASYPLSAFLERTAPRNVYALDWGIVGPLRVTGGGHLPVRGWLPMEADWEVRNQAGYRALVSSPRNYFVAHVSGSEVFTGRREALAAFAEREGYREEVRRVIRDRHRRPVFEVFHFVPMPTATGSPSGSGEPRPG